MSTTPAPICFGVCCPTHGTCLHYLAVDGADPDVTPPIDTCRDAAGHYPLYIAATAAQPQSEPV